MAHEDGLVSLAMKQASAREVAAQTVLAGNELVLAFAAVEVDRALIEDLIAAVAHQSLRGGGPRSDAHLRNGSTLCGAAGTPMR